MGEGRLRNKSALVTGAGGGIGKAIATALAREGARVAVADIDAAHVEATCSEIKRASGHALSLTADLCDAAAIETMAAALEREFGGLHILINNAGIAPRALFENLSDAEWDQTLATNLQGTVRCTRAVLELLKRAEGASVINLASVLIGNHLRKTAAYAASKGALASMSRTMALEFAPHRIRVNYICPGFIRTEMTRRYWNRWLFRKYMERRTPLGRFGEPEDVARAAVFLASSESDFITGTGLVVDGGLTLGLLW